MRLIRRQSEIVSYLLNPEALREHADGSRRVAVPEGLDARRLSILGLFSLGKRQEKVSSVLPHTFALVRGREHYGFGDFAAEYPQCNPTYFANGKQYVSYLQDVWSRHQPDPPWLPDIARYEIEHAAAHNGVPTFESEDADVDFVHACVRRHPNARLSRYQYDIRPIIEGHARRDQEPSLRDVRLVMLTDQNSQSVKVYELKPAIYDVLDTLDAWLPIHRFEVGGVRDKRHLLERIQSLGLVEISK